MCNSEVRGGTCNEALFQSEYDVCSDTIYFWIWILKNMYSSEGAAFSYAIQSQNEKQSCNNAYAVLNEFTDL